jgi:hypothetical protein
MFCADMTWLQFANVVDPLLAHLFLDVVYKQFFSTGTHVYEVVFTDIVSVLEQHECSSVAVQMGWFFLD